MSALCNCEIYEHCSICDPDYFKTVSASKPRQAITPSQPNDELDKAIEKAKDKLLNGTDWSDGTIVIFHSVIQQLLMGIEKQQSQLLLAAKRSKELEKERDSYRMALEERNEHLWGATHIISTLRTAYKQALEAIEKKNRVLCFFASVIKSGEAWSATCEKDLNEALSTPRESP